MSVCIIVPVSRKDFVERLFVNIEALTRPTETALLIVLDGNTELEKEVEKHLDILTFDHIQVAIYGTGAVESIEDRRWRISAIHNYAKDFLPTNHNQVLLLEDDTIFPDYTLMQLLDTYERYEDAAFVEGVQLGRHGTPYVGAWRVNNIDNTTKVTSMILHDRFIDEIDAGGFYCALTDADLYKQHHFEPYDQEGRKGLSCDFNYGMYLRRKGYGCYLDWGVPTGHVTDDGIIDASKTEPAQVQFTLRDNRWGVLPI
jgi:hypothetical protein